MGNFLIFYAPFIVLFLSIVFAFWAALKDDPIKKSKAKTKDTPYIWGILLNNE
ncbi:hypothetical protein ACI2OX_11805 [Bacillus sp. N9]